MPIPALVLVVVVVLSGCAGAAANETERACRIAENYTNDSDGAREDALDLDLAQIQNETVRAEAEQLQQAAQRAEDAEADQQATEVTRQIQRRAVLTQAVDLFGVCVEQGIIRRPE